VLEIDALHVLHGDVGLPRVLADVVDGDDVGMAEAAGGLGFAQEPHAVLRGVRGAQGQRLHGHPAVEPRVPRQVHGAHAAATEDAFDHVLPDRPQVARDHSRPGF
jgi:hypothetical protein